MDEKLGTIRWWGKEIDGFNLIKFTLFATLQQKSPQGILHKNNAQVNTNSVELWSNSIWNQSNLLQTFTIQFLWIHHNCVFIW